MALPRVIRNFNSFIDGFGYFGIATEAKLPQLKIKTEGHQGSGMDAPVGLDMGMEGMSSEITLSEWSVRGLKLLGTNTRMVLRPAAESATDTGFDTIIATMGGLWSGMEFGDLKPGTNAPLKLMLDVRYYRMTVNGVEIHEIDVVNGKRVIGGVDQLAGIRRAMGL